MRGGGGANKKNLDKSKGEFTENDRFAPTDVCIEVLIKKVH